MRFRDRTEAGRRLAERLAPLADEDPVVLALPRGGVPVAYEVATALRAPLDVIVVRKLGVPTRPELGMGAIGEDGARIVNDEIVRLAGVSPDELERVEETERIELARRAARFRSGRPRIDLTGRTALLVDDGIATGSTARAACRVARAHGATRVVLAVPVAPVDAATRLAGDADELISLQTPTSFLGVGQFYRDFAQTSDDEVVSLLDRAAGARGTTRREEVEILAEGLALPGDLTVPECPSGVVVFAHGSGSSRRSPRNREVASVLHEAGIGTLLFDLLTADEALDRSNVFDVDLLGARLHRATKWLRRDGTVAGLPVGYFGASTGAAAALWAAAEADSAVAAVVSRGGRPDLAGPRLGAVLAPTRLIVGAHDDVVLELNVKAQKELRCENDLIIVPGAGHLFEEPGTLDRAAVLARDWFRRHFAAADEPS